MKQGSQAKSEGAVKDATLEELVVREIRAEQQLEAARLRLRAAKSELRHAERDFEVANTAYAEARARRVIEEDGHDH